MPVTEDTVMNEINTVLAGTYSLMQKIDIKQTIRCFRRAQCFEEIQVHVEFTLSAD